MMQQIREKCFDVFSRHVQFSCHEEQLLSSIFIEVFILYSAHNICMRFFCIINVSLQLCRQINSVTIPCSGVMLKLPGLRHAVNSIKLSNFPYEQDHNVPVPDLKRWNFHRGILLYPCFPRFGSTTMYQFYLCTKLGKHVPILRRYEYLLSMIMTYTGMVTPASAQYFVRYKLYSKRCM